MSEEISVLKSVINELKEEKKQILKEKNCQIEKLINENENKEANNKNLLNEFNKTNQINIDLKERIKNNMSELEKSVLNYDQLKYIIFKYIETNLKKNLMNLKIFKNKMN